MSMIRSSNINKDDHQRSFTPFQIEFLAEDEPITIIPNFKNEELHFMSGTYGPFVPSIQLKVPLWLAITLKKKKKCRIIYPTWLNKDYLDNVFKEENENAMRFEHLPKHYIEIATMLLAVAPDDATTHNGGANEIRGIIEDLINRRQSKLSETIISVLSASDNIGPILINNITMMEINRIRPSLCAGLDHLAQLSSGAEQDRQR
ncbi:hypothetical protein SAMD00019534_066200 [Acytostelium subglobosum LB1]|uniref:hypothetical protein n=1 Tax=Acytostelium subglobosum LB1 TaxID=1410327 RepID=UPI000644FDA3|nr:hypothetical protein SAMD00019534_066200 [Acytostelium subglobosum LB1]GAM23445.1 hypothetical protein SAMD00019534_066200 [Acytostelium subglobosum LB1]|eukprot:XP_012753894.1 hypothetical protein SAMD00019534_066200 [Acytostelium subglobosum LB1]